MSSFKLTLAILKPDVVAHPIFLKEIKNMIIKEKFLVVASKTTLLSRVQAESFYLPHKDKFFYNRLVHFMTGGPLIAAILYRDGCISKWRELMGPTKVFKTIYDHPNTIRGKYGLTDTRNCTHGSDSMETALAEIKTFFPQFDALRWLHSKESEVFQSGQVKYNEEIFCHEPLI